MINNQNKVDENNISAILLPHQIKSRNRYPLQSIQSQMNAAYQSTSNQYIKKSFNLSESKLFNYNGKDLELSLKQKYKLKHISLVHQLIASARSKKSQIQDLLRKQQNYAELEQLDQNQITHSLRKLKKVVRLMEIVCKIIIGKNQSNNLIDISTQQSMSIKQIHEQAIANYQHQLNIKNCQIKRLKKLVEILSVPQENQENSNSQCSNNSINNSLSIQSCFIIKKSNAQIESQKQKNDIETQTEHCQVTNFNKKYQQNYQKSYSNQEKKLTNFIIHQQYSLWNILDAKHSYKQLDNKKQQFHKVQQSTMVQVTLPIQDPLQTKNNFLKRYKSIVKVSINSLTLCNNIFIKCKQNPTIIKIQKQIDDISKYFNSYYHNDIGKYNENIDNFCKSIKEKISVIYENLHKIYKAYINDKEALSYWNDSRINF